MSADLEGIKSVRVLEAFVTGSQAYGTATPNSDIDLVCFVSEETKQQLVELSGGFPVRFGKLNLILETSVGKVAAWKAALGEVIETNAQMAKEGLPPLDKMEVCHIHADYGIPQNDDNPSATAESREAAAEYRADLRERKRLNLGN
jgi:hypothetical protein